MEGTAKRHEGKGIDSLQYEEWKGRAKQRESEIPKEIMILRIKETATCSGSKQNEWKQKYMKSVKPETVRETTALTRTAVCAQDDTNL